MQDRSLVIRPYREGDDERIIEITKLAWPKFSISKMIEDIYGSYSDQPWWRHKVKPILSFAKANPEKCLIAVRDRRVVGYAMYTVDYDTAVGTVSNNAVDPAAGGKGIGTALNREVLGCMKKEGMKTAMVCTLEHQAGGRKMYEKNGFEEFARRVDYARSLKNLED